MNIQSRISNTLKVVMFSVIGVALILGILLGAFVFAPDQKAASADQAFSEAPLADEAEVEDGMALDEDFELPVYGDGERLFCGKTNIDGTSTFFVAFVLSENGNEIHDVTIFAKDLNIRNSQIDISGVTITEKYSAAYPVGSDETDIDLGGSKLNRLIIDENHASGEIEYVYNDYSANVTQIPVGKAEIQFEDITDTAAVGNEDIASEKDDTDDTAIVAEPVGEETDEETIGHIVFEDSDYSVTIGEIGLNEDGNTTIEVQAIGIGSVLPMRNGEWAIPVQAMFLTGGEVFGWDSVTTAENAFVFTFETDKTPEQIVLYPYGGKEDESTHVIFDAQTKTILH